ncbi:DNA cytosine methyltransferase [Crossiella sp. SN42]|uniref:DNA cytosine methyltransferase n=1 Tax=Crossiella sp. SN42 TaxID=2944808 RepID=UPI00207CCBAC|nr:DNA cytosine methyltransferase [Crossiella sp. SN42]MCO1581206.1 DNA cytosine methyltransferase [Crossiella sp. SN42]
MLTVTDLFCGAGGSGLGATAVPGVELVMAANHSPRAIETHQVNFPGCAHDCADISQVEPRRYRATDILWASPECTNHSVAKGRKRSDNQPDLFGEVVADHVAERSRSTMWDVVRFAEVHTYRAVIVENVVDAANWTPFRAWLQAMDCLGYDHHVVYLNSMHAPAIAAPRAPQSRDRMYIVFWRKGNPAPELEIRPLGWCLGCDREVECRQVFKPRGRSWPMARWGRYRAQYLYACTTPGCSRQVEPYALPAAAAIDWDTPGERIGDRVKPLSDKTLARIRVGLERYGRPMTIEAAGNTYVRTGADGRPVYSRGWPVDQPTATLTTTATRALLVPSGGTWNETASTVSDPFRARTTREMEALVVPVEGRDGKAPAPTSQPLRTQTTRLESALVVPYYSAAGHAHPAQQPLGTVTTLDRHGLAFIAELRGGGSTARQVNEPLATVCANGNHHGLVQAAEAGQMPVVEDCTFRMLQPAEVQAAMAFTPDYVVTGTRREQIRQLGNGVTPPAAEFLVRAVAASLDLAAPSAA